MRSTRVEGIVVEELDEEFAEIIAMVGPRRREQIIAAARQVAEDVRADAELLGADRVDRRNEGQLRVLGLLPAQTFGQSRFWRHQFALAAERLCEDTQRWGAPVPRCSGEEMALHLILRRAAVADTGLAVEEAFEWPDESNPGGWGDLLDGLFQDHDVLMLYEIPAEGVADGVNLAPQSWFSDFGAPFPVPDRLT